MKLMDIVDTRWIPSNNNRKVTGLFWLGGSFSDNQTPFVWLLYTEEGHGYKDSSFLSS
jgi:hypothetical protein